MWKRIIPLVFLLSACGAYEKEQVTSPTNFTTDRNALYNSNFEIWQRGTEVRVADHETGYGPDRWYVVNELGDSSVVKVSRTDAVIDGSRYAVKVEIEESPKRSENHVYGLYQTLDRVDSAPFYNKKASAHMHIRALKNVSKVGVQFMISTSETKVNTPIGEEAIFDLSPHSPTEVSLNNQEIGTQMTLNGVIGIRIRVKSVKEGSRYERESGFIVEQATVSSSPFSGRYAPKYSSDLDEYTNCLRFFEKSYPKEIAPGTVTPDGAEFGVIGPSLSYLDSPDWNFGGAGNFPREKAQEARSYGLRNSGSKSLGSLD